MFTSIADVVWPALYLEDRIISISVILGGLFIEYFFVWRITNLGALRSLWADVAMNAASTLLGFVLVPLAGLVFLAFVFSPIDWTATFVAAVLANTTVEFLVLRKGFKQTLGKRGFWLLCLANALSVGLAFGTFIPRPLEF